MLRSIRTASCALFRPGVLGLALGAAATVMSCADRPPSSPEGPSPAPSPSPVEASSPPAAPSGNLPPELVAHIRPRTFTGPAPLEVTVDLCGSSDPEGGPLVFAYEWAEEGKRLSSDCLARHVYDRPTRSRAFFCVWDRHPEHLVCTNRAVDVF